jgi:hypothetical protein
LEVQRQNSGGSHKRGNIGMAVRPMVLVPGAAYEMGETFTNGGHMRYRARQVQTATKRRHGASNPQDPWC